MCVNVTENVCFDCNVNGQCWDCSGQWGYSRRYSRRSVSGKKLTTSPGMWTVEDPRRKIHAPSRDAPNRDAAKRPMEAPRGERKSKRLENFCSDWKSEI